MKIAWINGSPKLGKSNSESLLQRLEPLMANTHEITFYNLNKKPLTQEQLSEWNHMDALVFAFPLYIDAIPSHLFRIMVAFDEYRKRTSQREILVYALINNGFYEGEQNHIAADILKNWCVRANLTFGMAIGQGAGEMIPFVENVPTGHGPMKNSMNWLNVPTPALFGRCIRHCP